MTVKWYRISKRVDVMTRVSIYKLDYEKECLPHITPIKISEDVMIITYDEFLEKQEKDISDDAACN